MKTNFFSITFWFNLIDSQNDILNAFQKELNDEYNSFNVYNVTNNYYAPIMVGKNPEKKTTLTLSRLNLQYDMDASNLDNFSDFKERVLKLFEILESLNIELLHTAIFINGEIIDENALEKITKKTINKSLCDNDLVDITLKIGKKHEDLFYKIVTILNKKEVKIPTKLDELGRNIPLPLISWKNSIIENEIIDVSYEINDKYLFDTTDDYHTTEFYLNKMLYFISANFKSDIESIINKGKFE